MSQHVLNNTVNITYPEVHITFVQRTLNIDFENPNNASKNTIIEIPFKNISSIQDPLKHFPNQYDPPLEDKSIELPSSENITEKLAVRLIVIRKKKMKKHKRKKLCKRMRFEWAKLRHRRNVAKEKAFQAELIGKIKAAESFDAKEYVNQRLTLWQKKVIPKTYRGEILPESMIKEFLEKDKEKKERKRNKLRLKLD